MPEGDTIYRTASALHRALAGRTVTQFETALAKLTAVNDDTPIAGRTVERVEAKGKWCLVHLSSLGTNPPLTLLTHMLMSGSWHIYRTGEKWFSPRSAMRVVLTCGEMQAVGLNIPVAEFHTERSLARHPLVQSLGPDVLGSAFDTATGINAINAHIRSRPGDEVGNMLLNQRVIAGLGNVYKSEVAFAAGVHPFRKISTLTPVEVEKMVTASEKYMQANVANGARGQAGEGITTYSGKRRTTREMNQSDRVWVYGRSGQECRRCGAIIEMRRQGTGARSTYWCPQCQPWRSDDPQPTVAPEGNTTITRHKLKC